MGDDKVKIIDVFSMGEVSMSPYRGPEGEQLLVDANGVRDLVEKLMSHAFSVGFNNGQRLAKDADAPRVTCPVPIGDIFASFVIGGVPNGRA